MRVLKITAVAMVVAGLLIGCAQEEKPEGVIPQGYKDALDKAEDVGDELQESLDLRGQEIEESER